MTEVSSFFKIIQSLIGEPVAVIIALATIVFIGYYFIKLAPLKEKNLSQAIEENSKATTGLEKMSAQYERALENSNKVIENNTAALKSTQQMVELFSQKMDNSIEKTNDLRRDVCCIEQKVDDVRLSLTKVDAKIEK